MSLRIAFAGASGTGKTTLAKFVAETFGLEMNPIGSRSVSQAMGFASPYDVDKAGRRAEFQTRLLCDKRVWESGREIFVTDRTTFDNLVYQMLHDVDSVDKHLLSIAIDGSLRYTHIIICPMNAHIDLGDDAARKQSSVYHELFETTLRGFIGRYVSADRVEVLNISELDHRKKRLKRLLGGASV